MKTKPLLWIGALTLALGSCASLAIWSADEKQPAKQRSEQAIRADALFWETLHGGHYDRIPQAMTAMTAAYLENPNDAITAAHVGWLHIWTAGERARLAEVSPAITDNIVLSRRYFEEAVKLNPAEARYRGFYASLLLAEGDVHHDEKITRRGYYTMLEAIRQFPEFNLFTAGYIMSTQPYDSARFAEALEYQWKNLDVCVGERVDRSDPNYGKYMALDTKEGSKRVCWNSWIAPHNFEGFFLNFGDMLVKAGQVETAQAMYRNAMLTPDFATWPYRKVLEERMRAAEQNVNLFRRQQNVNLFRRPQHAPGEPRLMFQSAFSCTGCHQR